MKREKEEVNDRTESMDKESLDEERNSMDERGEVDLGRRERRTKSRGIHTRKKGRET